MFFEAIGFLIAVGFGIYLLIKFIHGNDDYWPKRGVPFVPGSELGSLYDRFTIKLSIHELDNIYYKSFKKHHPKAAFGGVMELRSPMAFVMDPEFTKQVMVKSFDHFTNRRLLGGKNDPTLFDKTLFSIDNPEWKDLRATMSPTFSTGKIRRMFSIFTESANKMAAFLREEVKKSPEIDFRDVAGRYTMDVIASAAFGVDSQNFKDKDSQFAMMGRRIQDQFKGFAIFKILLSMLLPKVYALFSFSLLDPTAFEFFKDVVKKTIKHREATGETRNDFLQLLMETRSDKADALEEADGSTEAPQQKAVKITLSDEMILAQCIIFFIAGFDTTESLIMYSAYELALNPEIQAKLASELQNAVDEKGELSYETVIELEYLDMVISETLRKYPPVVLTERKCVEDFVVPESRVIIKKDQIVRVPVWSIHHDETYYPESEKFLPERFTKENKAQRNPYTYMPFGVGPRNCIAMRFALTEGKAALAHLVLNFRIEPSAKTPIPIKYNTAGNLKPIDGLWLKVTPK